MPVIRIPDIISTDDKRTWSAFFTLINDSKGDDQIVWDFHNLKFISNSFLNLLALSKDVLGYEVKEINVSDELQLQMSNLRYNDFFYFEKDENPDLLCDTSNDLYRNTSPICKFNLNYKEIDKLQGNLYKTIKTRISEYADGWVPHTAISYLISELCCNIQEHSQGSCGYLFIEINPHRNTITLCIADNGITIHGSYINNGSKKIQRLIGDDSAEAIYYAVKGLSTKNRPENENRGYGLSTNLDMIINGLRGSFTILSGKAFFNSDYEGEYFLNLPQDFSWDGTLILIDIPLQQKDKFNVYDYIE